MNDLTIWLTYHDERQIQEYGLKETETIRLFKGNDVSIDGDNINHLNRFYSEMTTHVLCVEEPDRKPTNRILPLQKDV